MQELLAQSSFDKLKEGAIVPGIITEIRQNEVAVDIGGKSEGVVPASEFVDVGELQNILSFLYPTKRYSLILKTPCFDNF